jgi:hypothetical protein
LLKNQPLSEEQREKFLADLADLPSWKTRSDFILFERINLLGMIALYAHVPNHAPNKDQYINWNIAASQTNQTFDLLSQKAEELAKETDPVKKDKMLKEFREFFLERQQEKPKRFWLSNLLGKPITVGERSRELAWKFRLAIMYDCLDYPAKNDRDLAELRKLLCP